MKDGAMTRNEVEKRLRKCSFDSIVDILCLEYRVDRVVSRIEAREFEVKSKKYLDEMDASIETSELCMKRNDMAGYLKANSKRETLNKKLDELHAWFTSKDE